MVITTEAGVEIEVRRLGFLELEDNVPFDDPGPYIHRYKIDDGGSYQEQAHTLDSFGYIPQMPSEPREAGEKNLEVKERWMQYDLYQGVLQQEVKRAQAMERHKRDCARYMLEKCIPPSARADVVTARDADKVFHAATCPEVRREDLARELATTFPGIMEIEAAA